MEISWTWLGLCAAGLLIAACVLGFRKGFVKEVVSAFFMILSFLLVWVINPYVNSFLREYTPLYTTVQQSSQEFVESQTGNRKSVDRTEQSQIVENLNIPDLLKNKLKENNTAETYRYLAVNTFTEYISDVLPSLGEDNTLQTTFADYLASFLTEYKDVENFTDFVSRYYSYSEEYPELVEYKQSDKIIDDLDAFISNYIDNCRFTHDFKEGDVNIIYKDEIWYIWIL